MTEIMWKIWREEKTKTKFIPQRNGLVGELYIKIKKVVSSYKLLRFGSIQLHKKVFNFTELRVVLDGNLRSCFRHA